MDKVIGGRTKGYICDGCGCLFHWDEECSWFGSYLDMEDRNFNEVWIACCQGCADKMPDGFPKTRGVWIKKREF